MMNAKALATKHATGYIASVFADSLREAGFVCPNDDLLCWYRKRSDEIINSIIFRSRWSQLPLFLEIDYGIVPAFVLPVQIKSVVSNDCPDQELFTMCPIVEDCPNGGTKRFFSENVEVLAPIQAGRGLYTLEELLIPSMDRVQTIEEAYAFHKERRLNCLMADDRPEYRFGELTKTFIDMALWVDDSEMYALAALWANRQTDLYETLVAKFPLRQQYALELKAWKQLQEVLDHNGRDHYVAELAQRMQRNTEILRKRYLGGT